MPKGPGLVTPLGNSFQDLWRPGENVGCALRLLSHKHLHGHHLRGHGGLQSVREEQCLLRLKVDPYTMLQGRRQRPMEEIEP